jgi:hypothetical protein
MSIIDSDLEVNADTRRWTDTRFVPLRTFHLEQGPRLLRYFGVTNHYQVLPLPKTKRSQRSHCPVISTVSYSCPADNDVSGRYFYHMTETGLMILMNPRTRLLESRLNIDRQNQWLVD